MTRAFPFRGRILPLCASLVLAGCAAEPQSLQPTKVPLPPMREEPKAKLSPPGMPAVVVAELAAPDKEVRFARNGARAVVATRSGGRWLIGPVRLDRPGAAELTPGKDQGGLRAIHPASEGSPAALHRHGDGFVLAWVETIPGKGEATIQTLELDAEGLARGPSKIVGRTSAEVKWVDVLGDGGTNFVLWDATRTGAHDVAAVALGPNGATPPIALDGGRGWHAVATRDSLWLASTTAGSPDAGQVHVQRVAVGATELAKSVYTVDASPTALDDVEIASVTGGVLVAWSDRRDGDVRVRLAALSADGTVTSQRPLDRVGYQALVGLAASEDGARALVVTERVGSARANARTLQLHTVRPDGSDGGGRGELAFEGTEAVPALLGDGSGFGVVTLTGMRLAGEPRPGATTPTFVRLDADLRVKSSEPIRLEEFGGDGPQRGLPVEVRSPMCERGRCTVVAMSADATPLLAVVEPVVRESNWAPAAQHTAAPEPPLADEVVTLATTARAVLALDTLELPDGRTLLAWLEEAPTTKGSADRPDPNAAHLLVRVLERDGRPGPVSLISDKALADGGLDLEGPGAAGDGAAALAWVGPNPGPQVFVTKLGFRGEKLQQRSVTRLPRPRATGSARGKTSAVHDVDLAVEPRGGFVVAFSDEREGEGEIYLLRLDARLERRGSEQRVTTTPGASTEPALMTTAEATLVAWSETSAEAAQGDIRLAVLDPTTLKPLETERELVRSAGHSRSPRFGAAPGGGLLVWLEEPTTGPQRDRGEPSLDDAPGLRLASLDARGRPLTQVARLSLEGEAPAASSLTCDDGACRVLFAVRDGGELRLDAVALPFGSSATPLRRTVASFPSAAGDGGILTLTRDAAHAHFVDGQGRRRWRALSLRWTR